METPPLERRETQARKAEWLAAMRWRRRVSAALRDAGLTFTQWLVLSATQEVIESSGHAVSHKQVGARVELDAATICQVMRALQEKDLLSYDVDMTGKAWQVFLNQNGQRLLREQSARVEAASASPRPHSTALR